MEFVNATELAANVFTGFVEDDVIEVQLCARATYVVDDDGLLVPHGEPWPLFDEPLQTKYGAFPIDRRARANGCEVVITGTLRLPKAVTEAEVKVRVDDHERTLRVIGDRVWKREGETLVASEPTPFTEMPLDWSRALGGVVEFEGAVGGHPLNPQGRGFYLSADEAADRPLPNLENPAAPIARWNDRPTPACWASVSDPMTWYTVEQISSLPGLPAAQMVERLSGHARLSACRPDMVLSNVSFDSMIEVSGLTPDPWSLSLAQIPKLRACARCGPDLFEEPLGLDGIWFFVDQRLLVLTLGASMRVPYRQHELRTCELSQGDRA